MEIGYLKTRVCAMKEIDPGEETENNWEKIHSDSEVMKGPLK